MVRFLNGLMPFWIFNLKTDIFVPFLNDSSLWAAGIQIPTVSYNQTYGDYENYEGYMNSTNPTGAQWLYITCNKTLS